MNFKCLNIDFLIEFDFKQVVNEDQATIDSLAIRFFAYTIFFELLSFIMLALTIPLKKSKEQQITEKEQQIKDSEDKENDLFAEQRLALENEIKEQKQKQKIFQLQQELNAIKQQTDNLINNAKENKD